MIILFFCYLFVDVEAGCFSGYIEMSGSCYKIYTSNANFATAKSTCEGDGGYLVSVTSSGEATNVLLEFGGDQDFWIGLKKIDGSWSWLSGETFSYTNWGSSEPDGSGDCVRYSSDVWKDRECSRSMNYLCEAEYAPTGEPSGQPTAQPSQPSSQPSSEPSSSPSGEPSAQPSNQPSNQPSSEPSAQPTSQPSGQPSSQPTGQPSIQPSAEPSGQPSAGPSSQPSSQPSVQSSGQPSAQPSLAPTGQPSSEPSSQPTDQPSALPSNQPSGDPSSSPTGQPSDQPTGHPSAQPSSVPSGKPSTCPSSQPTDQPSRQPSDQPSAQPSAQPSGYPSFAPTGQPSTEPSSVPTDQPSAQPSSQPSGDPSSSPTGQPSIEPTGQPSAQPSSVPSGKPSSGPSSQPTDQPSRQPSDQPSAQPSAQPSGYPSFAPTGQPSTEPSSVPTDQPSALPSNQPSGDPSSSPTGQPSAQPTGQPSAQPSSAPTGQPSTEPSSQPTDQPSAQPSNQPSGDPSSSPTGQPSAQPSSVPSGKPSSGPSSQPTDQPSRQPSDQPSAQPSAQPSGYPSFAPTGQPSTEPSSVPTDQPSALPSSQPSGDPSSSPTGQPSIKPTGQPSVQPSTAPSGLPSFAPTGRPSSEPSSQPTDQPSAQPSSQPSGDPSSSPTGQPSDQPTGHPSAQPTSVPSRQPSACPSSQPSSQPSLQPSGQPSGQPSMQPTGQPSVQPSAAPSGQPSFAPIGQPSSEPSSQPTDQPSAQPSSQPSGDPSSSPTGQPSDQPTGHPSAQPSSVPSGEPSTRPSSQPSSQPSLQPSGQPSGQPSIQPTGQPSVQPSAAPSEWPSTSPSSHPTEQPSAQPTSQPSLQPSLAPSGQPSVNPSEEPSTTPSEEIYHDHSPDILEITMDTSSYLAVDFVELLLTVSDPAIVFCGAFAVSDNISVSAAKIKFQKRSNVTFFSTSRISFYGLQEFVNYKLYCLSTTLNGQHEMALANILNTELDLVLPCKNCNNYLTVDILSRNVLQSEYMQWTLSIDFADSVYLTQDVVAYINVTLLDHVDNGQSCSSASVVLDPHFVTYRRRGSTGQETVNVYMGNLCPGLFRVDVKIYPAGNFPDNTSSSADGVVVSYSNGDEFQVFMSHLDFEMPKAISANFVGQDGEVVIRFTAHTDFAQHQYHFFSCSLLLSFPGASSTRCHWYDSLHLVITLNSGSTLLPGDQLILYADLIGIPSGNTSQSESNSLSKHGRVLVGSSKTIVNITVSQYVFPIIDIYAPKKMQECAPFSLDLTSSAGHIGRPWRNASIIVRMGGDLLDSENISTELALLNDFYANVYVLEDATALPTGYMRSGYIYVFDIQLCNCLMKCGRATHIVVVDESLFPFSSYDIGQFAVSRAVAISDAFHLPSSVIYVDCDAETYSGTVATAQTWEVYEVIADGKLTPIPIMVMNSSSIETFVIPPYSLLADSYYEVREVVDVTIGDNVSAARVNTTFYNLFVVNVIGAPVVAVLSKQGHLTLGTNETMWLDASMSYDSNFASHEAAYGNLKFHWECLRMGPSIVDVDDTDCTGFLNVNSSSESHAAISTTFLDNVATAPLDSTYRITLFVFSFDWNRQDSAEVVVSISNICCVSINIEPLNGYNVKNSLHATSFVESTVGGNLSWSVSGMDASNLHDAALTPVDVKFEAGKLLPYIRTIHLILPPFSLEPGLQYTIQLAFVPDYASNSDVKLFSSIVVVPNSLPLPGIFTVAPVEGLSLLDIFSFKAKLWTSDELPLLYSFGFYSASTTLFIPLKILNSGLSLATQLPQGAKRRNYNLTCVLHVVDNAGGRADSTGEVRVVPGQISKRNMSTAIDNLAALETSEFISAFTPILESVSAVNCTLAPNCTAYNRQDCSAVSHTCGPCLSSLEFFGEADHHNSRCAKRNEPVNIGGNISCFDDSSCPVFESCDEGNCVATMKQCSGDCSGHGSCRFVVTSTREELSNQFCAVGDTSCSAECLCDSGWFGLDCSRSAEDMQLDIELYERMVCLFADAVRSVERPSSEVVGSWLNQLSLLSQDVFAFSHKSSLCSLAVQLHILDTVIESSEIYSYDTLSVLLDSTAAILDYHKYFDYHNQTVSQKAESLVLVNSALQKYCEVVSGSMVPTQHPFESDRSRLRILSTVLTSEGISSDESVTEVSFSTSDQEDYYDLQTSSVAFAPSSAAGWCMVSMDTIVYSDFVEGAEIKSDILSVMSSSGNISGDSLHVTLQSQEEAMLTQTLPRLTHNVSCTTPDFGTYLLLPCPHNVTHELFCSNDTAGTWEVTCPSVTMNMTCRSIRTHSTGLVTDTECEVSSVSGSRVECDCPAGDSISRAGTNSGDEVDREVDVEFVAMLEFVVEDFVSTWQSADDLSIELLKDSKQVLITLGLLISFFVVGMHYTSGADKLHESKIDDEKKKAKQQEGLSTSQREGCTSTVESAQTEAVIDLDCLFPSISTEEPLIFLFLDEVKKSHRWASIYFNYDKLFPRALRFLSLFSVVVCTLFFNSLLYNLTNVDDGSCKAFSDEESCLEEPSEFSSWDTKCYWDDGVGGDESGKCGFKEPSSSALAVIYVAMLSAIFSIPFVIVFEYVIMEILSRPTADSSTTVQPHSNVARDTFRCKVSGDARIMESIIYKANSELKVLVNGLYEHLLSATLKERTELESLWGLTCSELGCFVKEPYDFTPGNTLSAGSSSRSSAVVHPLDGVTARTDVDKSRPSLIRRTINAFRTQEPPTVFQRLFNDILAANIKAEEEYSKASSMPSVEQGIHLLLLFQKDLLSGLSGEIAEKKSELRKQKELKPVSKWLKLLGFLIILVLDLTLLFYIFLFAVNQTEERQSAWVQSFLIWLALEILLVSSFVMVMSEFVVPSLIYSEAKKIKNKMIDTVHKYQEKILNDGSGSRYKLSEKEPFDAAPVLFISTRLANMIPEALESKIIKEFRTTIPKKSYQHDKEKSSMGAYRARLRITAIMNSVNLIFLFVIGRFMSSSVAAMERCVFDLLGWVGFGYFLFWQAILFRDNVLVAFVVYMALFLSVGEFVYYYHKSACRLRITKKPGVISIKTIYEEKKKKVSLESNDQASAAQLILQNVVRKFQLNKKSKYNPRFARIMKGLREAYGNKTSRSELDSTNKSVQISFQLSSSSDEDSGGESDASLELSRYVDAMQRKTPLFASKIRNRKSSLHRIMKRRTKVREAQADLRKNFALDVDMSDCSEDSYPVDDADVDMYSLSSDSEDNISEESESDDTLLQDVEHPPPVRGILASAVWKHQRSIAKIRLKNRAKAIEDDFVLNSRARRLSIVASQARAHSKLRKRIEQRKAELSSESSRPAKAAKSRLFSSNRQSSNKIFNEKKDMVKRYTAHQTLLEHTLATQRMEAKAALQLKIEKKKNAKPMDTLIRKATYSK